MSRPGTRAGGTGRDMGKSIPVTIGSESFPSKGAAWARVQELFNNRPHGVPLMGPDHDFAMALLLMHQSVEEKIGPGVEFIFPARSRDSDGKPRNNNCLYIKHVGVEGDPLDFSGQVAISGRKHYQSVRICMRAAIEYQKVEFRNAAFAGHTTLDCALTGLPVTRRECHVDHVRHFEILADRYAEGAGGYGQIRTTGSDVNEHSLLEPHLSAWREFHREHAELRIVTAKANLSRPKATAADHADFVIEPPGTKSAGTGKS